MATRLTINYIHEEIRCLVDSKTMTEVQAKAFITDAIEESPENFIFSSPEEKSLIMDFINPKRVLH